jgi:transposase
VKVNREARTAMKCLADKGQSKREIARLLGVSESTVRYHLQRQAERAHDGRADQRHLAEGWAEHVAHYVESLDDGPVNLAALHDWLVAEHGYPGSLRSVQRFWRKHYPKPRRRARRRVETPPGAQGQADWAEWPRLRIGGREVYAYQFHLRLSFSRFGARVWSPRKDQLAWHRVHNEAFRRIDGVPAVVRVDNERTAMSRGAGAWGEINPSYRRYARTVRFHVDPCPPRSPHYKGKVERGIRTERRWREITRRDWASWEELQAWTDHAMLAEAEQRICPATGGSVIDAWNEEKRVLAPVPLLPEPFDVAVTRTVARDCTVAFEGRRYSVPFHLIERRVELHGCAQVVQVWYDGRIVAEHRRHGRERIVTDPVHFEGTATDTVIPPPPLGRMGRRLQEIAEIPPERRPLDLYEALAEVAR